MMFKQEVSSTGFAGEAMLTCLLALLGFLLTEILCFWFIRLAVNQDMAGKTLLIFPLAVHTAGGLALSVWAGSRPLRKAQRVGLLLAWILGLPVACYINFIFNFHLTW